MNTAQNYAMFDVLFKSCMTQSKNRHDVLTVHRLPLGLRTAMDISMINAYLDDGSKTTVCFSFAPVMLPLLECTSTPIFPDQKEDGTASLQVQKKACLVGKSPCHTLFAQSSTRNPLPQGGAKRQGTMSHAATLQRCFCVRRHHVHVLAESVACLRIIWRGAVGTASGPVVYMFVISLGTISCNCSAAILLGASTAGPSRW